MSRPRRIGLICLGLFGVFLFIWTQPNFQEDGTVKVRDRNNVLLFESAGVVGKKIPVSFTALPENTIRAAVAAEDTTFWTNPGIDVMAMGRSLLLNLSQGKVISGASTITQQLARGTIIAPNGIASPTIIRKIREVLIALRLSLAYPKEQILMKYLNSMYFGNRAYGIGAAAATYFAKDVSQLSISQSAFLVGLISSPDSRNPYAHFEEAKKRQEYVLDQMIRDGFISSDDANQAKSEPVVLVSPESTLKAPHFVDYVLQTVNDMGFQQREGMTIKTTLDYSVEAFSEEVAQRIIAALHEEHDVSNASLILLNNETGEILTMLGGTDYYDATHSGQVNMTTALRQPGSALKPITYATAFMQGFTAASLIYDVPTIYHTKTGEGFAPHNYDGRYHGLVLAREALASSLNLPAVEMLSRVGVKTFIHTARDLGIRSLNQEERYDLSLTLGGGEVSLLDLTNVYAGFARGGTYVPPYAIETIESDSGRIIYQHARQKGVVALGNNSQQVAYLISNILSDPKARLLGFSEKSPLVLTRPAAVKTGTTTDWHDNWTVGYTPSFTVGVWVGNNDNHPMRDITGVVGAAPIWNQFFGEFLKGKPVEQFVRPEGLMDVEICAADGALPDDLCPEKAIEMFVNGTEPIHKTQLYKKVRVDSRNGLLAGENCPQEDVKEKIFLVYPAQLHSWAVENSKDTLPTEYSPLCVMGTQQPSAYPSFVTIISPTEKTEFESAPLVVPGEVVPFQVSVSPDIRKVIWIVDGHIHKEVSAVPFSVTWSPQLGSHTIVAKGLSEGGTTIESTLVHISVVGFHDSN